MTDREMHAVKLIDRLLGRAPEQAEEPAAAPPAAQPERSVGFAAEATERFREATALVIGVGAIGGAAAPYLVAAGVRRVLLCDFGGVQFESLTHEVLYGDREIRRRKVEAATERLQALNRRTQIHALAARADEAFLDRRLDTIDIVIDASNNGVTRQAVNAACVAHRTPWLTGMAAGVTGRFMALRPDLDGAPCWQCAGSVDEVERGFSAPVAGIVGSAVAMAALQVLSGQETDLALREIDTEAWGWRNRVVEKREGCAGCGSA